MEEFIALKTKVYFLQHFLDLDVDKWPEIKEFSNVDRNEIDEQDSFESWIAAEFIPIYDKVKNYKNQTAEVNELKSKINEYEEKLAEYRQCFTDRDMQPIEVKNFLENLNSLAEEITSRKLAVKNLAKDIDDLKRNAKSANANFDEFVRLLDTKSDVKHLENVRSSADLERKNGNLYQNKFEIKTFDEIAKSVFVEFSYPDQKLANIPSPMCLMKKETKENALKNEYRIIQIDNGTSEMDKFVEDSSKFYDAKMQLLILYDMWIKNLPLASEIETLKEKFALDWDIDEHRMVVLFGNTTCNIKVESLEKFEIESVRDLKSKKPIEIKKPRHCKSLASFLDHLKEKLSSL